MNMENFSSLLVKFNRISAQCVVILCIIFSSIKIQYHTHIVDFLILSTSSILYVSFDYVKTFLKLYFSLFLVPSYNHHQSPVLVARFIFLKMCDTRKIFLILCYHSNQKKPQQVAFTS